MHLTLHLTGRCNMRCRYCYDPKHSSMDISMETVRTAIALAVEDNQRRSPGGSIGIVFFGGEPLLMRSTICETIHHCREVESKTGQPFFFRMTTNGLLLDEEFLTDPVTRDIYIALSIDGIEQAHDAQRILLGGGKTHESVTRSARLLLQHKPYAPAMMTIQPGAVPFYARSVAWLRELGFHYLICTPDYSAEWTEQDVKLLEKQYRELGEWYIAHTLEEDKFYFSPFEAKIGTRVFPGKCRAERCELGQKQISVAPNGRLYPCVQFVKDGTDDTFCIGHVDSGLDETARSRLYLKSDAEKVSCRECSIRERCNHHCGCLNQQTTGNLNQVAPVVCAHEQIVLREADRIAEILFKKKSGLFIQKHYNEYYPLISLAEDGMLTLKR